MIIAKEYKSLLTPELTGWRMAGAGGFSPKEDWIESFGGPGILWYADQEFADFVLRVRWRLVDGHDNSGVFIRIPALANDIQPAIDEGYEIQIDDRGVDPATETLDSPLHRTGAIYGLAPAIANASAPVGIWNDFEIAAQGPSIEVTLNDVPVSRLEHGRRRSSGHIGLQAHHDGSRVQFQLCEIRVL
ncbi:MAG TPA: DUF1080 domain-containing protein [Alphaproteobacteria bacterium]